TRHGEPPPMETRIREGHYAFGTKSGSFCRPTPITPPFALVHPGLRELFSICFEAGHGAPSARPDAQAWIKALQEAEEALVTCVVNDQHSFSNHLTACPWCERKVALAGRDPFPSKMAVQRGEHRGPSASAQMPHTPAWQPATPLAAAPP